MRQKKKKRQKMKEKRECDRKQQKRIENEGKKRE